MVRFSGTVFECAAEMVSTDEADTPIPGYGTRRSLGEFHAAGELGRHQSSLKVALNQSAMETCTPLRPAFLGQEKFTPDLMLKGCGCGDKTPTNLIFAEALGTPQMVPNQPVGKHPLAHLMSMAIKQNADLSPMRKKEANKDFKQLTKVIRDELKD